MKRLILSALAIIVFLTGLGAGKSLAQEEDMLNPWIIDGYDAVAYIDIDGSATIEEYITFKFTREFDGVLKRQLDTTGATSLDDFSVYKAVDIDHEDITKSELEEIKKDSYRLAADEEYGMVNGVDITLGVEAKEMTLLYKYKLNDLIGIYNDGALFNWTFIDDRDNPGEGDMSIKIVLPKGVNMGSVQSFLQGPLYIQETEDDNIITFDTNHIVEEQGLKLSLLLPASHISEGRKRIENNIAGKIT
ncbi:MAG: DUF2207 domain-containing protein, partial [Clostridiales bacterium]|nr:DUF2207 domain-containing protein [Clostridiales bacterium]